MPFPKKLGPVASLMVFAFVFWLLKLLLPAPITSWDLPDDMMIGTSGHEYGRNQQGSSKKGNSEFENWDDHGVKTVKERRTLFQPGKLKPAGEAYTKTIIIPHYDEDIRWISNEFDSKENIRPIIYEVGNITTGLHPPQNKGHEVMVYLTYIIDHYTNLTDTNIFLHAHRTTWHNNDFLNWDSVEAISRLSSERVQREGYMNLRCHWDPGCPAWIHPGNVELDSNKIEESFLARAWGDILPGEKMPRVLSQPCCGQFAVSRDRIRENPLDSYVYWRNWLLDTKLPDNLSGRIWEYLWQYIFTGKSIICPLENICYCDGYGVCFGGVEEYERFWGKVNERDLLEEKLEDMVKSERVGGGEKVEVGRDYEVQGRILGLNMWIDHKLRQAKVNGGLAVNRAREAGRVWKEGHGF